MKLSTQYELAMTKEGILIQGVPHTPEEGRITLREPSNKEWNEYSARKMEFGKRGRGVKDRSGEARCELFDRIVTAIDNIEDGLGPICPETKDRLPARYKERAIFLCFEDENIDQEEQEKN
jgi:hypothetical protein